MANDKINRDHDNEIDFEAEAMAMEDPLNKAYTEPPPGSSQGEFYEEITWGHGNPSKLDDDQDMSDIDDVRIDEKDKPAM